MKKYPMTIEQCIEKLKNYAGNMDYCEIEGLLWSGEYLKDYLKLIKSQ